MGLWLLGLFTVGLLFYGTYLIIKTKKERFLPVLYIVVNNQADTIEGILRLLVKGIRRRGFPGPVVIIDDFSQDETIEILKRLEQELDFIVHQAYGVPEGKKYGLGNDRAGVYYLLLGPQSSYRTALKEVKGFLRHYKTDNNKSKVISKA
ncbi:hypothetical protein BR63_11775 [Thermanaerosceptrum fracticalcis]|uniref:Glycosyltransferase n=1 Tax=Thermanaerosceptrum fracticalcis TaxID=1712410 RepID=A0A7G6E4C4_THEFR|nr:hypothetical protein [Thermanaerosceptrum fracticalcis]QNB46928.1 hypothetical protein BR63_11775 [Thermanaerosceptrum fracticalcis]